MRSAVYTGTVFHRRYEPVEHHFSYRVALPLVDLDEVDQVCALHRLWSVERPNAVSFRRADFLGAPTDPGGGPAPLADAVRDTVAAHRGIRPDGPVAMLAHLRTWGWLFNPITLYYCFDPSGTEVEALVAEVTNTPWHERHSYVVGPPGRHRFAKQLHVSPFFGMDQHYRLSYAPPGSRLTVRLGNEEGGRRVFDAVMVLERRPMSSQALAHVLRAYPAMTLQVTAGIYRQALALRRAGVPVVAHPAAPPRRPGRLLAPRRLGRLLAPRRPGAGATLVGARQGGEP